VDDLLTGELDGIRVVFLPRQFHVLVVQNPRRMGKLAVETLVAAIRGQKVETVIDTGVVLVTREMLSDPEIAKLLE